MSALISKGIVYVIIYCLALACEIGVRVFMPLYINYDARSKGIKNKKVWIILSVFQPYIVGLIYVICRKKLAKIVPKMCRNCRTTVHSDVRVCPTCSCVDFDDYSLVTTQSDSSKARLFLVLVVVFTVLLATFSSAKGFLHNGSESILDGDKGSVIDDFQYENPLDSFGYEKDE